MAISTGTVTQGAAAEGVRTTLNTGGTFVIYSGTPPTNAQTALSGNTVLATHTLATFSRTGGTVTAGAISDVTNAATGTATFFRCIVSGTAEIQGTVGVSGSGADAIVNSTAYTSGGTSQVVSMSFTVPSS